MLICRICLREKSKGDATITRTRFSRLNDHIRRQHPEQNVSALTSIERNKSCRSKGQRRLFKCTCRQVIVRKKQHLKSRKFHPELVELTYQSVKKITETRPDDEVTESSDEEDDLHDMEEEGFTLTKEYITGLKKNARVMQGRRDFKEVLELAAWRKRRVRGAKDDEKVDKGKLMINRFLALVGYSDDEEVMNYLSNEENILCYDEYMVKNFNPGTVRSSYCYVNNFLDFLLWSKKLPEQIHKTQKITISNLSSASKKADLRRRKSMRREETSILPENPSEVMDRFRASPYVMAIRQQWKNENAQVWREMRGLLLVEMASKNGTRCGEFRNMKYKHVKNAIPFKDQPDLRTLVNKHAVRSYHTHAQERV